MGITPRISFPMLRSDSATREALFRSCAPPSSAPELGRAFWGQLLPSHHRAGPRGRTQRGSPACSCHGDLGLFPPPQGPSCCLLLSAAPSGWIQAWGEPTESQHPPRMTKIHQNPKSVPRQVLPRAPTSRTAIYTLETFTTHPAGHQTSYKRGKSLRGQGRGWGRAVPPGPSQRPGPAAARPGRWRRTKGWERAGGVGVCVRCLSCCQAVGCSYIKAQRARHAL